MKDLFKSRLACGTALATMLACTLAAQSAQAAKLDGSVAAWVSGAARTGTASDSLPVSITVHMALKDRDALKQLVFNVSKPGNPLYGRFLTTEAFRSRFAPDAADVAAAQAMLAGAHMTNITVGSAGATITATATVGQLRATFGVSQDLYKVGNLTVRANREAPTVPDALAGKIVYIEGLDELSSMKHPLHVELAGARVAPANSGAAPAVTPPPVAANAPSPYCSTYFGTLRATLSTKPNPYGANLPWLGCGYTPQQIKTAYGLDKLTAIGTGVTVAITDAYASPTLESDGNQYAANHGLPPLTTSNFKAIFPAAVLNANPSDTCMPYGWWGEQSLDVAAVHGSAPGANIVYVGSTDCMSSLTVALFNTIYDHRADIITNSWSFGVETPQAQVTVYDNAFMAAAATGISVLFSSGDDGDLSQVNGSATGAGPADSQYATSVGGTSMLLRDSTGAKSEYGWGNYRDYLGNALVNSSSSITTTGPETMVVDGSTYQAYVFYSGSGGGISVTEPQPSYQAGVVSAAIATTLHLYTGSSSTTSVPHRVTPDVSMVADPYTGYLYGETMTISGNSITDAGCTPTGATTEYCEEDIGGTSLASPLLAGMLAVFDETRLSAGKPVVGFFNPLAYTLQVGTKPTQTPLIDILPPSAPTAVLRGYQSDLTRVRVVSINSVPALAETVPAPLTICASTICEGINDVFNFTTPGYDDVTGLGVPYAPKLVTQ